MATMPERIAAVESTVDQHETRLGAVEQKVEDIHELATSVSVLAEKMTAIDEKVDKLIEDENENKKKYRNRWETVILEAIKVIIAGIAGAVVAMILSGGMPAA